MALKLKEAAEQLPGEDLVVEYDNGGGQSGTRENPFFAVYARLLSAYTKTLAALEGVGGGQTEASPLDDLRARLKVVR